MRRAAPARRTLRELARQLRADVHDALRQLAGVHADDLRGRVLEGF